MIYFCKLFCLHIIHFSLFPSKNQCKLLEVSEVQKELTVFEQNGQLLTDSREVAVMVEKSHDQLLRSIRSYINHLDSAKLQSEEFFIESTYTNSQNKEMPCYLCTKKGCDMIANKMTGKKGVIFTAKYIEAFEKMKEFIEKGQQYNHQVSFKEQVECIEVVADMLKANDASKLLMLEGLYKSYELPTEFLPNYEHNGSKELKSATELLKQYDLGMSAAKFNTYMVAGGYLEIKARKSAKDKTKEKKFKALTAKGLQYGENAVSPHNQREVQPLYYADSFKELFQLAVYGEVA